MSNQENARIKKWLRWIVTLCGSVLGACVAALLLRLMEGLARSAGRPMPSARLALAIYGVLTVVAFFLSYILATRILQGFRRMVTRIERKLDDTPMLQVLTGALGLLMGLGIAALISTLYHFGEPTVLMAILSAVTYAVLGYLGASITTRRWREFPLFTFGRRAERHRDRSAGMSAVVSPVKILDTSVIIDGRVFDICKCGFLEGPITVPQFVLAELRHIADSSDALRRGRGRRGLDILQRIQKELSTPIVVDETDFDDIEVDVKLLKLAQQINGVVVTNDYNLNKVASVTGVKVLNINELANAVRSVVMHGEEMAVQVVREGKEPGQGVGYLDDGTMIVVDNGRRYLGESLEVVVTTVLQT
ncbi:MAG: TRAM domain-containing protein, partial [Oscillospiraceae bacterium]|nr:TRAM domain-containing protein [Oscillospiraceae bacterium]